MYASQSLSFHPTSDHQQDENSFLQNHIATSGLVELQQQQLHSSENMNLNMQLEFGHDPNNTRFHQNWEEISFNPYNNQQLSYPISNPSNFLSTTTPSSSLGLLATSTNLFYEPPQLNMPLNLYTPQSSLFKELFHLSPHGSSYGLGSSGTGSLFSHGHDQEEVTGSLYHDGSFHELSGDMMINSAAIKKRELGKDIKHHASEKQRRVHFSDKFQALRTLIPNPSKNDRATIIADAIGYIHELKMRVNELKIQVDLKKERIKRQRSIVEEDGAVIMEANQDDQQVMMNKSTNWHHQIKSSKNTSTEVDVRIMEDEVIVKLVQQKQILKGVNCLLLVSKALDELQLDLQHVAGGLIGDHYSYLLNSKICEGCTVYASVVANKVIEVLDKEHADIN
ncbi:transcription factor bHLH89-like [Solanum verrucosum]|uniref:transcription factor bHLH89-like n=1 Tax=Solanum verrucosum TaxID=315347 RepID=UPI0020D03E69|nr:transcription factor bHLH89-like [Solanum verrucosum]